MNQSKLKAAILLALTAVQFSAVAANSSATGSTASPAGLDDLLTMLYAFSDGTVGRIFAFASALIGAGAAVVTQSLKGKVGAIGIAAACAFSPSIIEGVFAGVI